MENGDSSSQLSTSFSIPRGGPIFLPDLVSPLIRVSTFECDVFLELESLKAELADFDDNNDEEDISVEELKIYSEEELVSEAMKIAFEDDEAGPSSDLMENPCNSRAADDDGILDLDTSTSFGSSNGFSCEKSHDGVANGANLMKNEGTTNAKHLLTYKRRKKINQDGVENDPNLKKMERGEAKDSSKKRIAKETSLEVVENGSNLKKRKRRANGEENCKKRMKKDTSLKEIENCANLKEGKRRVEVKAKSKTTRKKELVVHDKDKPIDETYLMKVEHLAKIRQKQEQDKASVKLHSFNFNHGKDSNAVLASGNIETLKYLELFSCPFKVWFKTFLRN